MVRSSAHAVAESTPPNNPVVRKQPITLWRPQGTTPRTAPEKKVQRISFDVHEDHLPALRSAVQEINDTVATRMETKHAYPVEDALVRANIALSALRAVVFAATPAGDPMYPIKRGRKS